MGGGWTSPGKRVHNQAHPHELMPTPGRGMCRVIGGSSSSPARSPSGRGRLEEQLFLSTNSGECDRGGIWTLFYNFLKMF